MKMKKNNQMSETERYVAELIEKDAEFSKLYDKERERNKIAAALVQLRETEGLSQRQFAKKVGKPHATISKIESGAMNVSTGLLAEIARKLDKTLEIRFV